MPVRRLRMVSIGLATALGGLALPLLAQAPPTRCAPTDTACLAAMRGAAHARADSATAQTDTIVATPSGVTISVGDSMPVMRVFKFDGLDSAGRSVPLFAPSFALRRGDTAARIRGGYLVGLAPGETVLFVTGTRVPPIAPALGQHPLTQLPVVVRP